MKKSKFDISICIPNYNRPHLVKQALESIINQTVKPFEVLVVDDVSTDDMSEIKDICFANGYKFIQNKTNLGLMKNINHCIDLATGEYITLLHNDDILSPYFIEETNKFLNLFKGHNIYTTNGIGIDDKNHVIAEYRLFNKSHILNPDNSIEILWNKNYLSFLSIIGCTIYKTKFLQKNLFNEEYGNEADLDNAMKFLKKEPIMYVDIPIYFTRLHKEQESQKNKFTFEKMHKYLKNRIEIYSKYKPINFESINYMQKIKALHVVQLQIKYKYSLNTTMKLLEIDNIKVYIKIFLLIPVLLLDLILKKIRFEITNKNAIKKYLVKVEK